MLKVIGGKMRGMNLESPSDKRVRPTTNRIKEDLFNIIMPYIYEADFLDLFSGSGAVGIEAISRGAAHATLVDNDFRSISLIKKNIEKAKSKDISDIIKRDAINFIEKTDKKFDIIYMDPPYDYSKIQNIIEKITRYGILKADGVLCVEHDKNLKLKTEIDGLICYKEKTYSLTKIDFYKKEVQQDERSNICRKF